MLVQKASLGPTNTKILMKLVCTGTWCYNIISLWVKFLLNKRGCRGFENVKKKCFAVTRRRIWAAWDPGITSWRL